MLHLNLAKNQLFQSNLTIDHFAPHLEIASCIQQKAKNSQLHLQLDEVKNGLMLHMDLKT